MTTVHVRPGRSLTVRYLLGDDLIGTRRGDATFFRDDVTSLTLSRWARMAGWKRSVVRVAAIPTALSAGYAAVVDPAAVANSAGAVGTILATRITVRGARRVRQWRHRHVYVRPLARVLGPALGEPAGQPDRWLHISPDMAGLAGRLIRPMSPAEIRVREWYGRTVLPVLTWAPDHTMRVYWSLHERAEPFRKALAWFRVPTEPAPARVEITLRGGFATKEQRDLIRQAVVAKLGLGDLVESWDQVGPVARVVYTVRDRPPSRVGLAEIRDHLIGLAEHEFIAGLTTGNRPVIISLDDDAPHVACSAGSGAGKSVLAKVIAAQVLSRGGRVVILDRKGSHRWAKGLAGVEYCTTAEAMHNALIREATIADDRNATAFDMPEGWDPGERRFVIFEEMNATVAQLQQWWEDNREKSDPKTSPAVVAFRQIMYMGRSAKVNLFAVAQMLTARTTNGPEARENFGVRFLARYTANAWKMLAPECPMPRKSKTRGRWQVVIAGESTEVQVAYLTDAEAQELANVPVSTNYQMPSTQGKRAGTTSHGDEPEFVSLRDAQARFCPTVAYETLKKRRDRARRTGGGPRPRGQRGRAELYDPAELVEWLKAEELTTEGSSND